MDWECEFLYNLWKVDDPWQSYVALEKSLKNGQCNFLYKPSNVEGRQRTVKGLLATSNMEYWYVLINISEFLVVLVATADLLTSLDVKYAEHIRSCT